MAVSAEIWLGCVPVYAAEQGKNYDNKKAPTQKPLARSRLNSRGSLRYLFRSFPFITGVVRLIDHNNIAAPAPVDCRRQHHQENNGQQDRGQDDAEYDNRFRRIGSGVFHELLKIAGEPVDKSAPYFSDKSYKPGHELFPPRFLMLFHFSIVSGCTCFSWHSPQLRRM